MSKADRRLTRFIKALIADRRPPRTPAGDDSAAMQVATRLRAAHPGGSTPSPAFVDNLARQLRDASGHEPGWTEAGIRRRRFLVGGLATVAASVAAGIGAEGLREALTTPASGGGTMVFHLMPVGNPAPPRPRRPDFVTSAITSAAPISIARARPRYPPCAR